MSRHNAYRNGHVYVCSEMCATCIFKPGNLMDLRSGRVKQMVDQARNNESAIVCHRTLGGDNAVCRGFFDRWKTRPLRLAEQLEVIVFV